MSGEEEQGASCSSNLGNVRLAQGRRRLCKCGGGLVPGRGDGRGGTGDVVSCPLFAGLAGISGVGCHWIEKGGRIGDWPAKLSGLSLGIFWCNSKPCSAPNRDIGGHLGGNSSASKSIEVMPGVVQFKLGGFQWTSPHPSVWEILINCHLQGSTREAQHFR